MPKLTRGMKVVVASHNKGKVWEIHQLLAPYGLSAISAGDLNLAEPAETETTFTGNALIKARAACEGAGLPALADDSGLEIEALGGEPGVYSADWAGPQRDFGLAMQRVHDALSERDAWKAKTPPRANFISVLCLAWPGGAHQFFKGRVFGHLVWPPRGGNGFGYDPMFVADGESQTYGEMEPAKKYADSHRTRAFAKFKAECLDTEISASHPNAERDLAGLTAAAANISTREELVTFIANLRAHAAKNGSVSSVPLDLHLAGLERWFAAAPPINEPHWRTLAKALLASSVRDQAS
jgi:XTP/dITP diphosphohydrolase